MRTGRARALSAPQVTSSTLQPKPHKAGTFLQFFVAVIVVVVLFFFAARCLFRLLQLPREGIAPGVGRLIVRRRAGERARARLALLINATH